MLVLIDNYDSFTYNIVHAYQDLGQEVKVVRNSAIDVKRLETLSPSLLVIGPGPGEPKGAGISKQAVELAKKGIPIVGICLGHQVIGEVFGADVIRAPQVMHGKTSAIYHTNNHLFQNLSQGFLATRYHSLIVDEKTLPEELVKTAWTEGGEIMGISHRHLPIHGVQFHPESIASEYGSQLLENTLELKVRA